MNGMSFGGDPVANGLASALVLVALALFGVWYNRKIDSWGPDAEGFTWLQVAIGSLVTIIGAGILNLFLSWNAFFLDLLAFTASGIPMIRGDIQRYLKARKHHVNLQKDLAHDTTETLAKER